MFNYRKLLLSLPSSMVELLDEVANTFGMCRSDVIRRSLTRDLAYMMSHEVPKMQKFQQETVIAHKSWLYEHGLD